MAKHGRNDTASVKDWAACASAVAGLHRRQGKHPRRLPHRILVSGGPGRARLVRLIAAGLRAGAVRTLAKTASSSCPRLILPDGSEQTLPARSRYPLVDQAWARRTADEMDVDALVTESTTAQPSRAEVRLMWPTQIARFEDPCVAGGQPTTLRISGAFGRTPQVQRTAHRHAVRLRVNDDDVASISWDELCLFPYIESPETIALAIAACAQAGVARAVALPGMILAQPGPGLATVHHVADRLSATVPVVFINGFATYTGESTNRTWQLACNYFGRDRKRVAIVNCRTDHADRADQLGAACATSRPADHYFLVGDATHRFAASAVAAGMPAALLTDLGSASIKKIRHAIEKRTTSATMLLGLGSFQGAGCELATLFRHSDRQPNRELAIDQGPTPIAKAA